MPDFEQELAKLNQAQRSAVDTIEGPVMCVAGPGTGKTQVVAMRVANILKKTQMRPSNILCLTFSSSGATAMRERLRSLIGADAYSVTVTTIHGFCNDLIGQHPNVFDTWSALENISDVERFRAVNAIVESLLPDLELVNKKSPYTRTKDIIGRISQVKREGKSADDLKRVAKEYRAQMESKSKEGTKAHEKDLLSARKFEEFIIVFEKYQEMLQQTQRYDYDDMILHVIAALEKEEWLLAGLQERYQYVLVDEFQDTNGAQYRMIELLTTYTVAQDPNIFVVGDDDQAIYRFQGANLQNILKFHSRFPKAPIIVLTTSYRSTQTILDAAGRLIAKNSERLVGRIPGLQKDMHAASKEQGKEPTLLLAVSDAMEPWLVTQVVQERIASGVPPQNISVLAQTNNEIPKYYEVLRASGIPVQMEGKLDLLAHPLVLQTLCLLRGAAKPEITLALASAISCETLGCHPADVARLFGFLRETKAASFLDVLLAIDQPDTPASALPLVDASALIKARNLILDIHHRLESRTIVETLERLLKGAGLLPDETVGRSVDPLDFAALQAFFSHVRYRAYEQPDFSLRSLLSDIEVYGNPDYGNLRLTYSMPHIVENGVKLMTAHQSKGLEFDVVILTNFREAHWDKRRNPPSLSLPEDLLFGWEKEQKSYEQNQDERRVAYVAMTRAKKELLFTCPREVTTGNKAKPVSPSGFFAEAGPLPEQEGQVQNPEKASTLLLKPIRKIDDEFATFLRHRLETFSLSVTALNHFLEDPQMFLARDLLQTPDVKNVGLIYGNAVHAAMRKWGLSMQEGLPLGLERFVAEFRNYLVERELTTEVERAVLLKLGEDALPRYFKQRLAIARPYVHKVEYPIKTHLGDIPLKGSLDRLDLDHPTSPGATVIDYKTGKPQSEGEIRDGDYYRQLVFYALLLELGRSDLQPHTFILDFIGEGIEHPIERKFQIAQSEKEELKKIVQAVWAKILALDFTPL